MSAPNNQGIRFVAHSDSEKEAWRKRVEERKELAEKEGRPTHYGGALWPQRRAGWKKWLGNTR